MSSENKDISWVKYVGQHLIKECQVKIGEQVVYDSTKDHKETPKRSISGLYYWDDVISPEYAEKLITYFDTTGKWTPITESPNSRVVQQKSESIGSSFTHSRDYVRTN